MQKEKSTRYEPRKRTAVDGKVWWCAFDTVTRSWSTMTFHGKYRTKKECANNINLYHEKGWY